MDRAVEAVTGSFIAQTEAIRTRESWRIWRAYWADLGGLPPAERLVGVCMYCGRFRANTGEWVTAPPRLAEMLHDPKVVDLTHGACPICLAGHDPEGVSP